MTSSLTKDKFSPRTLIQIRNVLASSIGVPSVPTKWSGENSETEFLVRNALCRRDPEFFLTVLVTSKLIIAVQLDSKGHSEFHCKYTAEKHCSTRSSL